MTGPGPARARLDAFLDGLAGQGIVPGGVAVVATRQGVIFERAFGHRALVPVPEPATTDTLWDAASITKALVTAPLLLRRAEARDIELGQPVTELVPEMGESGRGAPRVPTLGELLLHSGGLPAWKPLYAVAPGGLEQRALYLARHRDEPGRVATYGCPGYQVLGLALERLAGRPLAEQARELLGESEGLVVNPGAGEALRCAPTEEGNVFERSLAGAEAASYAGYRAGVIRGQVHDHNAFTLGGFAGNAGLFATGRALAALALRFLTPGDLMSEATLDDLSRDLTEGLPGERRTWGFQRATSEGSAAGPGLSPRAFGHVGFTGTSAWIDPEPGAVAVLLTNRVHPRWRERAFNADRRAFHEAARAVVEAAAGE